MENFSEEAYSDMLERLFSRFPSFQKAGASAYKPGLGNMLVFDGILDHPHRHYPSIHVAGTNGKGSVSNMLASVLASGGLRVGLYTSPHILDFRERMKVVSRGGCSMIGRTEVWDFVQKWGETFENLDLSFFEITTAMAFSWFAEQNVDIAVIETGLGGRLDSTNVISPVLSVITNIGLDHCDLLGSTLPEIAFEKAGIIKPGIPAVVGESNPETDIIFERKVLYSNIDDQQDRKASMSLLTFADKIAPPLWDSADGILAGMDLQGSCQRKNLRTVLAAVDLLQGSAGIKLSEADIIYGIEHTAAMADFHGRWEKLSDNPVVIADIGHNSHGLRGNFARLEEMLSTGDYASLTIIYGAMADKDVAEIMHLLPKNAECVFVTAPGKRAMPSGEILQLYVKAGGDPARAKCFDSVADALDAVIPGIKKELPPHIVYIGGSTYVVSGAILRPW